jgi:hypothetical protein
MGKTGFNKKNVKNRIQQEEWGKQDSTRRMLFHQQIRRKFKEESRNQLHL